MDESAETPRPRARRINRRGALLLGLAGVAGVAGVPVLGASGSPPRPALVPAADDDVLDLRKHGARGDGVTDDTAAVQRLLDASARRRRIGYVPPGTYRCTSSLLVPSGVQLHLDAGARLLKDWAAPSGMVDAFVRNADFAVKSDRVRISGRGTIGARDHSRTGVLLALYGDDVEIRDLTLDTFAGGQAVMFGGDRGRLHRLTVRGSAPEFGTGGIRVIGGTDFLGTDCHVESGDDCLQFVPIGNPEAQPTLYNQSISGGRFVGCTGTSTASRFMVALLEFTGGAPGTTDMTASVTGCSFRDCHGAGSNRGIVIRNSHSSGAIERIDVTDCTVDMSGAAEVSTTQEIRIQNDPASGGAIRDVTFTRTAITRTANSTLRVLGPEISGVTFDGCTFTAPSGAAPTTAVVDGTTRTLFRDCSFVGAPGKRGLVAGPANPVTALSVEGCRFTRIGAWGVEVVGATGARVTGSTFEQDPGSPTARAIRVATGARGVVITGGDFTGITHPAPINDQGADTVLSDNLGL